MLSDKALLLDVVIILLVALGDVALILVLRRLRRSRSERGGTPDATPESSASGDAGATPSLPRPALIRRLSAWAKLHWREAMAALVLIALMGYVWAVTPRAIVHPEKPIDHTPFAGLGRIWSFWQKYLPLAVKLWPLVGAIALVGLYLAARQASRFSQTCPERPNGVGLGRRALRAGTLLAVPVVGIEAQLLLLNHRPRPAAALYGGALLGFAVWLTLYQPGRREEGPTASRMGRREAGLLVLILALTIFARFYALPRIPYGIEGDEAKWTIEVVSVMLDHRHVIQSEYHYTTQPVSFYMQAPFHHLLGPGILSARVAVATYSVLGSLAFYWLLRETLGPPVALLGTALLAVSLVDVSASRLALVEGHVKLWTTAGLAFLAHGLRVRRPIHSFLGGLALAVGLLTYDTFAPMVAVAAIWAVITLAARRAPTREWVSHLTALLIPIVIVSPGVVEYLLGRSAYYGAGRLNWGTAPLEVLRHNVGEVVQNFWRQTYGDFLFVRSGPIVNSFLVPLLAIGFVLALVQFQWPGYALPALWFALLFFPVPVYTGAPYVRVFYPGFPAIYALVALAAALIWRETKAMLPAALRPALVALVGLVLVCLVALNLYIYFNDLEDPADRQKRRELADAVTQAIAPDRRVYVPYFPNAGDAAEFEQDLFFLEARRKLPRDRLEEYVWVGPYSELLATLYREQPYVDSVAFVINRSLREREEDQATFLDAFRRCLGARLERDGTWFDLYVADAFDAQAARCAAPRVHLAVEPEGRLDPGQPVRFDWWAEDTAGQGEAHLTCERLRPGTVVVEAEDMGHDDGWHEDRRFVSGFRGRGYLADRMTLGSARVSVTLPSSGTYTLSARVYRRTSDPHPFLLRVDGQTHAFTWAPGDPLSRWTWLETPSLRLGAGIHTVRMARPVQEPAPGTLALFVDTLILSEDPTFDPASENEWLPFLESQEAVAPNTSSGAFRHDDLPVGVYRCWVSLFDDGRLLDQSGETGARSNVVEITVRPEGQGGK